ncbi:hypothetical protein GOV14_03310 [Candidatus Pacearchaeota archaeon]|nr:hypothetical protein [Candidatus Pacearchaeota archaeon]
MVKKTISKGKVKTVAVKASINGNSINQTTIKIARETKLRLNKLKEYDRESYDQILRKMLYVLNICRQAPEKAKRVLEEIDMRIKMSKEFDEEGVL